MFKSTLLLPLFWALCPFVFAQIKTPPPSPSCKVSQEIGLTHIEVEYSRPSAKGRKVFGDLVPFNEMWRTGANAATKITFSDPVKVAGVELSKGAYALYTIPGQREWNVVLYRNTSFNGIPGKEFNEADVAARFNIPVFPLRDMIETFSMNFNNLRNNGADLELSWEYSKVVIPISVDTDSRVMADIKSQMEGPNANTYYQSARYYYEEKKDMNIALGWIQLAIDKGGEKFWILRQKALILAELSRFKDAIAAAERSTELAKADGNKDYPKLNDKSIAEWSKRK